MSEYNIIFILYCKVRVIGTKVYAVVHDYYYYVCISLYHWCQSLSTPHSKHLLNRLC